MSPSAKACIAFAAEHCVNTCCVHVTLTFLLLSCMVLCAHQYFEMCLQLQMYTRCMNACNAQSCCIALQLCCQASSDHCMNFLWGDLAQHEPAALLCYADTCSVRCHMTHPLLSFRREMELDYLLWCLRCEIPCCMCLRCCRASLWPA